MMRLSAASLVLPAVVLGVLAVPASAQLTTTPGPGGVPIAPGAAPQGFTPGGKSFGGVDISPGPAARDVPMYRDGPGDVPVLVVPEEKQQGKRQRGNKGSALGADPGNRGARLPQNLQLTIGSSEREPGRAPSPDAPINSIKDLFAALNACWEPPAHDKATAGMQMSVRLSFKRTGEPLAAPRVTYATRDVPAKTKQAFRRSIDAAFERCGKMPFSQRFGAAIAGRPINARFVDDRVSELQAQ
jgi:hypothetical protein